MRKWKSEVRMRNAEKRKCLIGGRGASSVSTRSTMSTALPAGTTGRPALDDWGTVHNRIVSSGSNPFEQRGTHRGMAKDDIRILCTGDLHLGRHPTRIPADRDGARFSPKTVWKHSIERAARQQVDAVVVTGDVVDLENRYFEAYGAFEAAARALEEAGIPFFLVGGNHDSETLPRMIDDAGADNIYLLGRGGNWERHVLRVDGRPALNLDGWSFPGAHVHESPLPDYDLDADPDLPTIGVLHADLDVSGSEYAPVTTGELLETGVDGWLLGHIHKPQIHHRRDPFILYPGSPQPLDPGETGRHGPWLLRIDGRGEVEPEQWPAATVRYDGLEIDASPATDTKDVPRLVSESLEEDLGAALENPALELLLARIRLTGRCEAHAKLLREGEELRKQLEFQTGGVPVCVEKLEIETRPAIDLEDLARGDSPVAYLARLVQGLEGERSGDVPEELIGACRDRMQSAQAATAYRPLRTPLDPPTRDEVTGQLVRQARLLLDVLLQQKEGEQ